MPWLKITGRLRRSGSDGGGRDGRCEGGWPHCQRTTTGTRHDNAIRLRVGETTEETLELCLGKAASDGKHIRGNTDVGEVGRTNYRRRRTAISRTIRYVRSSGTTSYRVRVVVSVCTLEERHGSSSHLFTSSFNLGFAQPT